MSGAEIKINSVTIMQLVMTVSDKKKTGRLRWLNRQSNESIKFGGKQNNRTELR